MISDANGKLSPAYTRYRITIATHNENQPIFAGLWSFKEARLCKNIVDAVIKRPGDIPDASFLVDVANKVQGLLHSFRSQLDSPAAWHWFPKPWASLFVPYVRKLGNKAR